MYEYRARMVSAHDADTFRADIDVGFGVWVANQAFRLYGIDAVELGSAEGRAARDWLRERLEGKEIVIQTIKDEREKYGRWLAIVWLPGAFQSVNDMLVDLGMATPYFGGAR